jgi:hypothetical protein
MNGSVKCVENQGKNSECMHVKCKFVVIIAWNNFAGIYFTFTTFTCKEENIRNENSVGLIVHPHIPKPQDRAQACFNCLWSSLYA